MEERKGSQKRKFEFGDIVKINGYGQEGFYFRIESFSFQCFEGPDSYYEEVSYELFRLPDGQIFSGFEEDLIFVCSGIQALQLIRRIREEKSHVPDPIRPFNFKEEVDNLLDEYIWFMEKFSVLQDEIYQEMASLAFEELKELVKKANK